LVGVVLCVLGGADAIVEVGPVLVVVPLPAAPEPDDVLDDDDPVAGEGDTIDAVDGEPDEGVVVVETDVVVVDDACVWDAGLELSFGTPLAKGSRAIRASTTFAGSADRV
jgi:hypothetical protein